MLRYDQALEVVIDSAVPTGVECLSIDQARGRVLAAPIVADRDLPPFNRSERDGFAVLASDFRSGAARLDLGGETVFAGMESSTPVRSGMAIRIMTGAPLPDGADAVVPVEKSRVNGDSVELDYENVSPYIHIHRRGADAAEGQELLAAGHSLGPSELAVAISVGAKQVDVYRKIRVAVLSTGDELVGVDQTPLPSQIRDCNGPGLVSMIAEHPWLDMVMHRRVPDDEKLLEESVGSALDMADALILTGGVSMGEKDFVPAVLRAAGVEERFHKVAIRPGKPFWLGARDRSDDGGRRTLVFGLPGNPVAVQVTFRELVVRALRKMAGLRDLDPLILRLEAAATIEKKISLRQFVLGRLVQDGGRTRVAPVDHHGSGDFVSTTTADGVIVLPEEPRRIEPGDLVRFHLWRRP